MGDTIAQTRFENVSKHSNDPLLAREESSQIGRIAYIEAKKTFTWSNVQTDEDLFVVMIDGDDVIVETTTTTTTTAITDVEITLAQALAELKSAKPKADKVVIQEPEQGTTTPTHTTTTAAITITTFIRLFMR
ncbi:hypothetical protein Tco_0449078 [Tanacetum coccineum]